MVFMEIEDDTFTDKNLPMEGLISQDTDTDLNASGKKNTLPFDLVHFRRIKQSSRCMMCLGLLCAVLLAANIGQLIYHASRPADTTERDQLEGRLSNLTKEKDLLQHNYFGLSKDCVEIAKQFKDTMVKIAVQVKNASRLADTTERDQLEGRLSNLTKEKDLLQHNYFGLSKDCIEIAKQFKDKMVKIAVQVRNMTCKIGWTKFTDNCYIVSNEKKKWTASRDACNAEGANLVVINSRAEQAFVNGLLTSGINAWIRLTDSVTEGTWTWLDGTIVTTTYWEVGQPNSYAGGQDCGEFMQKSSGVGEWNDEGCKVEQTFICEQ